VVSPSPADLCVAVHGLPLLHGQVRTELAARGAKVSVAVFWGRERYVSILWRYLERNLVANNGIIDEVGCAAGGGILPWE
jgi:hypothetical protein